MRRTRRPAYTPHSPPGSVVLENGAHWPLRGPPRSRNKHICAARTRIPRERDTFCTAEALPAREIRTFAPSECVFLENGAHLHCQNLLNCTPARKRSTSEPPGRVFLETAHICWARADALDTCSSHRSASPRSSSTHRGPAGCAKRNWIRWALVAATACETPWAGYGKAVYIAVFTALAGAPGYRTAD